MYIDDAHPHPSLLEATNEGLDSDSGDDEDHDPSDVAIVPMADLLNARWGSENVSSVLSRFVYILVYLIRSQTLLGKVIPRAVRTTNGNHKEHKTRRADRKCAFPLV